MTDIDDRINKALSRQKTKRSIEDEVLTAYKNITTAATNLAIYEKDILTISNLLKSATEELSDVACDIKRFKIRLQTVQDALNQISKIENDMTFIMNVIHSETRQKQINNTIKLRKAGAELSSLKTVIDNKSNLQSIPKIEARMLSTLKNIEWLKSAVEFKEEINKRLKEPPTKKIMIGEGKKQEPKKIEQGGEQTNV